MPSWELDIERAEGLKGDLWSDVQCLLRWSEKRTRKIQEHSWGSMIQTIHHFCIRGFKF